MADEPVLKTPSVPEIQARLQTVARMLQRSHSLDSASQQALSELVQELGAAIGSAQVPAAELAHLADSTARLAESLHHQHDQGLLGQARDRFEKAVVRAEARAPFVSGLAQRLLETLANLGI
jgi:hypothetical protein